MTTQVADLFEWEGSKLEVCAGCDPPLPHADIPAGETWWSPESGRVRSEELLEMIQTRYDEKLATDNARRRAAGQPEFPRHVFSRYPDPENSTDCYRGYIATWAVRDRHLALVGIEGRYRLRDGSPVFVPYTGRFTLGTGKALSRVWEPQYQHHVHLDFAEGVLQAVTMD